MKFFNTAGPVNLKDHYALPPLSRLDADELFLRFNKRNTSSSTPPPDVANNQNLQDVTMSVTL